ncbi:MAG: hypothetical protein M3065_06765 [Actinomycetota bacterium]|nr:hypothetical protein [Actinomycetota bacterium]
MITRDIASRTGAETGLLAVFHQAERFVEVLCVWGAAPRGDHLPSLPADGLVGRVLESGHPAVEPIDPDQDRGLGIPRSGVRLTYAAGAAVGPPGGPPGARASGSPPAPMPQRSRCG